VLVVDDEPMLGMVVEKMLSAEGHAVTVAIGGPEASELVSQASKSGAPFDVVVSDIEMPVLNGQMLAEFIVSESPGTDVILMTGWTDRQIDVETFSTRIVGLLKKPPRLADITALLAVWSPEMLHRSPRRADGADHQFIRYLHCRVGLPRLGLLLRLSPGPATTHQIRTICTSRGCRPTATHRAR
jgi:CheY-like chemotaxis protein